MLRLTSILGLSVLLVTLSAGGAAALEPQPAEDVSSLSAAQAIVLFVGVPLLVIAVITALVLLPGTRGAGAADDRDADSDKDSDVTVGGATWINSGGDEPVAVEGSIGGRGARW